MPLSFGGGNTRECRRPGRAAHRTLAAAPRCRRFSRDWCDLAGLPNCSLHGLRKLGATIAAENGATDEEMMAIFGWTTKTQTTLYTKKARRKLIAGKAMHKLLPEQKKDETVPPPPAVPESGTKTGKKINKISA